MTPARSSVRYTRQVRLAEVGEAGQERLLRASVELQSRGASGTFERKYLEGAGVTVSGAGSGGTTAAPTWAEALDPAARDVAAGAYAALRTIKAILQAER